MNRSVLITGGAGGLGVAVTSAFADAGWRVVAPVRTPGRLPSVVEVTADLTDPASVASAVAVAVADPEAPLKAVVNLVGGFASGGLVHETPVEDFEAQFRANLRPTYLVCAATLPYLTAGGAIVCLSSRSALHPFAGAAGYVTSKAAVLALVDALAVEYKSVRVNAVLPSVIDTPANRAAMPNSNRSDWVSPAAIAETILFLCSDESRSISGARIPVYSASLPA